MYSINKEWKLFSKVNKKEYSDKYQSSIQNNEAFWKEEGKMNEIVVLKVLNLLEKNLKKNTKANFDPDDVK